MKKYDNNPIIIEALNFASEAQERLDELEYLATIKGTPEWFLRHYQQHDLEDYYSMVANGSLIFEVRLAKYRIITDEGVVIEDTVDQIANKLGISVSDVHNRIRCGYYERRGYIVERMW